MVGAAVVAAVVGARVVAALDDLRARARSLDPVAFKVAYEDMLTSIQHDL